MTALPPPTAAKISILQQTLDDLARQAEAAIKRVEATAEATIQRMARGTMDDTPTEVAPVEAKPRRAKRDTIPAPAEAKAVDLKDEVEKALRVRPMTITELAAHMGEVGFQVVGPILAELVGSLAKAGHLWNTGSAEVPRWVWILGDGCAAKDLRVITHALLQERPMTFGELLTATGARETRVYGILANLRRQGKPLVHLGDKTNGRWFLVPQLGE